MKTVISNNKENAHRFATVAHNLSYYKVYCDGSGYKYGVGAAAILYKENRVAKTLVLHVGSTTEHMVYELGLT